MSLTTGTAASKNARKILVAIDFGTTYSGVAWAQTGRADIRTTIIQWPDSSGSMEGVTNDKVPTQLAYDGATCKWGFQIPDGQERYQWFKLELDPKKIKESSHLVVEYPDPNALATNSTKTAEALSIDYLSHLREHIVKILETKVGVGVVASTAIEYIITVPAIWSDAAKSRTQACAKSAGMGDHLQIISEPEAAVIYALDAMGPETLLVGEKFVVCDAGGGTVDLISYTVEELRPILKVSEAAAGIGSACGSIFLNRIFCKYLRKEFSNHDGWDEDTLEAALERFETVAKRKFSGDQDDIVIPVPGLANDRSKGVMRGKLTMFASTLRAIFEPLVTTITALVMAQIRLTGDAKAVLLVGGFGQSPYLRESIRKVIGSGIQVIQPAKGGTAVVRGALIKGLAAASPAASRIIIGSRVARKAYGCEVSFPFDATKHQQDRKFWDNYNGCYQTNVMGWLIKKGATIKENESIVVQCVDRRRVDYGKFSEITCELYSFECPNDRNPPLYPDQGAELLVNLTADLSSIPAKQMPKCTGADCRKYFYCNYEIRVNFHSAHTTYSLWYEDKCYGAVDAEYA